MAGALLMGVKMIWVSIAALLIAACSLGVSYMNWRRLMRLDAAGKVVLSLIEVEHPRYKLINKGTHTASFVEFDLNSADRFRFSDTGPLLLHPGESQEYKILNHDAPKEKLPSVKAEWKQPTMGDRRVTRRGFIVVESTDTSAAQRSDSRR